jgi:predicted phage terminase large subunit-like protein
MARDPKWEATPLDPKTQFAVLRNDFASFAQAGFPLVTPGVKLIWAAYLTLICALLESVAHARRRKLIITLPPRHLKSYLVSVALPAYFLGHYPGFEVLCISYGYDLANGFAAQTQTIMQSPFYIEMFGNLLTRRRGALQNFRTYKGGGRRATSLEGVVTGVGGQLVIIDDPQKPGEMLSDAVRRSTNDTYRTTFHSRSNDPLVQRTVIVMQRVHQDDFTNAVMEVDPEFELINLPAIAEADEAIPYQTFLGQHVFRRKEGEALHPARYPVSQLETTRRVVGERVWTTQYQQRPAPIGGGLVKIEWFKRYTDATLPEFDRKVQSWDTANMVSNDAAYSVCTTWGVKGKRCFLLHVHRDRLSYPDLRTFVLDHAELHDATTVYIEEQASGIQLLQEFKSLGYGRFRAVKPLKDKATRMVGQTGLIEGGFVYIPAEAPWLADYLHEMAMFPNSKFLDQVDSTSQALDNIHKWTNWDGVYEFMRQDAELRRPAPEGIWVLEPPPGKGVIAINGEIIRPGPDGRHYLSWEDAKAFVNLIGWKVIPPAS